MPEPELNPQQRRRILEAEATLNDPEVQRRMQDGREALARHPAVVRTTAGIADAVAPSLRRWNDNIASWMQRIDFDRVREVIRTLGEAFLRLIPPNARALGVESWPTLQQLGAEEQLCLSWVPNEPLVRALCEASSRGARERILTDSAASVLASCREALDEVRPTFAEAQAEDDVWPHQLVEVVGLVAACVEAASDGHWAAAQALATCASDSLLAQHIAGRKGHTVVKLKLKLVEEKQFAALLLGPVLAAVESSMRQPASWKRCTASDGYSRNATVHAVSDGVFSEVNALKAIIMATSLLKASASPLLFFLIDLVPAESVPKTSG